MRIVCSGVVTVSYCGDYPQWCADETWRVLICPSCEHVNVILETKCEVDGWVVRTDANGFDVMDYTRYEYRIDSFGNLVKNSNGGYIKEPAPPKYKYPEKDIKLSTPHPNMPDQVKEIYEEARSIYLRSPRGAAALLRLAIQNMCKSVGGKGKNINRDIADFVKEGLPEYVQQALDIVRVVGNESVHPGEINVNEEPEVVYALFGLTNVIAEHWFGMPTTQSSVEQAYRRIPKSKLDGITARDQKLDKP